MANSRNRMRSMLLAASALTGSVALAVTPASAQEKSYRLDLPAQSLSQALMAFGSSTDQQIVFSEGLVKGRAAPRLSGDYTASQALAMLLSDTGLVARRNGDGVVMIERVEADPQSGSAGGGGAEVDALIVTAQKREEDIQDVPIAISAFTQETLERTQVAGGPDLMTQVPNMTFTKTNFTGYSIQLRGIGTQAISATTDAAVAVAFNNTPFIRNRFFEQEFYDLQRVEVLRGPQGTLYGRNATAGVVNIISQKPKFDYEAKVSADVANYNSTRIEGMVNIPLAEDVAALRVAGAWTKREGYSTNGLTGNPIDGRDLWSTRLSLRFAPTEAVDVNLIWEHFEENDDRLRSGKQLCNKHVVKEIRYVDQDGNVAVMETGLTTPLLSESGFAQTWSGVQGTFSQGCAPASLYAPESFQTPNGLSLPYVHPLVSIGVPINTTTPYFDPYASTTQSSDLRVIESTVDPRYEAETDVVELQFTVDLGDNLTITSETGYSSDTIFSTQDYNRFNTAPGVFNQPSANDNRQDLLLPGPNGGIFCDPQIGCADRLVSVDLSTARSRQFSQEFRISSAYDSPFNFSLGANYLRYDTEDKYYVFINTLSLFSAKSPYNPIGDGVSGGFRGPLPPYVAGVSDNVECMKRGFIEPDPTEVNFVNGCVYMDPNPIGSLNDRGHNYFLSKNPYKLISYAVFGEAYYNITEDLKVTAGLRWTVDQKEAPRVPSWIIAATTVGYPVAEVVEQEWRVPTGRLTIDWKPDLSFTDETMVYGSYAHGYKAGGMNPPAAAVVCYFGCGSVELAEKLVAGTHPKTFDAEYIDAFEIGAKNTLLDGSVTLNMAAFYYDYQGYQISQIVNRAAINQNFDATVWGLEIEADWRPIENLKLSFKGGYENTRVADGMKAVDVMDRTAGDPNWVVVRPFPTFPSNCILPSYLFAGDYDGNPATPNIPVDIGGRGFGSPGPCEIAYSLGYDPITGMPFDPSGPPTVDDPVLGSLVFHPGYQGWDPSTAPNGGAGISKDLSGNQLPNAPEFTATLSADYTVPLPQDWLMTLHTDLYMQSEAWTRIFNTEGYDKLKAYTNVNLAAIFTNEDAGWKVMAYVKNVFDRDAITGSFLNSDDTGLTTNVFMTEPRLYGLRVTKEWNGGPWWTGANLGHTGPYPLTVELGGQVQKHDAPYEAIRAQAFANLDEQLIPPDDIQNNDFDWGDGRSLKLTWRPAGAPWKVSASARYGRANTDTVRDQASLSEEKDACAFPENDPFGFFDFVCYPGAPFYDFILNDPEQRFLVKFPTTSWTDVAVRSREEHEILAFEVGYDLGASGPLSRSEISAGVRHANFESITWLEGQSLGNWNVVHGTQSVPSTYDLARVNLQMVREFSGYGPVASWEAAVPLWSAAGGGHADIEWSLTAGALFGDQETATGGQESVTTFTGIPYFFPAEAGTPGIVDPLPTRTNSVTVPLVDLSLGLSYEAGRIKVGAGYRWERYFDVLDAGYAEEEQADRTIDGPYLKIAVGFGG